MSRHVRRLLIATIPILCIKSCDCWTVGEGIVIDYNTKHPIDSVVVKSYIDEVNSGSFNGEMITDSTGQYFGSTNNTGLCKDLVIEFSKNGYKTKRIRNPGFDTIRMIKN